MLNYLLKNQDKIVQEWIIEESLTSLFEKYDIDKDFFKEKYAHGVFDHLLKIILKIREPGICPIIIDLMKFLKNKNFKLYEIYTICSLFKKHINLSLIESYSCSKETFNMINDPIDLNFMGVLKFYEEI